MPPHSVQVAPHPQQVITGRDSRDSEEEFEYTPLLGNNYRSPPIKIEIPSCYLQSSLCNSERWTFVKGIILSTLSGMIFTTNNFIIKQFDVVACDAILVRGLFQVVVLYLFCHLKGYIIMPKDNKEKLYVMIQGMAGAFSFICALLCVVYMPVADALVLMFSDPLVTMIAAAIFLSGERLSILRVLMGVFILTGVALVCKPPFLFPNTTTHEEVVPFTNLTDGLSSVWVYKGSVPHDWKYWTGAGFAVGTVLTGTYHNIVVPLCKDVKSPALVMWVGIAAIIVSSIAAQFDNKALIATGRIYELEYQMVLLLFGLAVSGMVAYLCLTRALQLISPTLVSSLRSLEIIFAYAVESIVFSSVPTLTSILGALLVIGGVSGIAAEVHIYELFTRLKNSRRRETYEQV